MFLNPNALCIQKYSNGYVLTQDGMEILTPAGVSLTHSNRRFIRYMRASLEAYPVLTPTVLTPYSLFCTQKDMVEKGTPLSEKEWRDALQEDVLFQRQTGPEMIGQVDAWLPVIEYFQELDCLFPRSEKDISFEFIDHLRWQMDLLSPAQKSGLLSLRKVHSSGIILPLMLVLQECSSCEYAECLLAAKSMHPRIFTSDWEEHIDNFNNLKEDANLVLEYIKHYEMEIPKMASCYVPQMLCA